MLIAFLSGLISVFAGGLARAVAATIAQPLGINSHWVVGPAQGLVGGLALLLAIRWLWRRYIRTAVFDALFNERGIAFRDRKTWSSVLPYEEVSTWALTPTFRANEYRLTARTNLGRLTRIIWIDGILSLNRHQYDALRAELRRKIEEARPEPSHA